MGSEVSTSYDEETASPNTHITVTKNFLNFYSTEPNYKLDRTTQPLRHDQRFSRFNSVLNQNTIKALQSHYDSIRTKLEA